MKGENAERIMTKFAGLKANAYAYVVNDEVNNKEHEVKKVKVVKRCVTDKLKYSL